VVIRICKSNDRQNNGQKKMGQKDNQWSYPFGIFTLFLQYITHKTKDRVTWTPLKTVRIVILIKSGLSYFVVTDMPNQTTK